MTFFIISHCSKQVWEMKHFGSNHFHLRIHHLFFLQEWLVIILLNIILSHKKSVVNVVHWNWLRAQQGWMLMWDDGCGRILKFNPAPSTAIHSGSLSCMVWNNFGRNHQKLISHPLHILKIAKLYSWRTLISASIYQKGFDRWEWYKSHLKLIYYQNVTEKLLSNSSDIGNCFLLPNEATFKQISSNFPTSIITSTEYD